jgi:hypothetical protein
MGSARDMTDMTEVSGAHEDAAPESASVPAPSVPSPSCVSYVTGGHELLFGEDESANLCDVCGQLVGEDDGESPAVPGRALYVWARGEELRREEPPLCPSCAAALGLSALGRWEIEEEEG